MPNYNSHSATGGFQMVDRQCGSQVGRKLIVDNQAVQAGADERVIPRQCLIRVEAALVTSAKQILVTLASICGDDVEAAQIQGFSINYDDAPTAQLAVTSAQRLAKLLAESAPAQYWQMDDDSISIDETRKCVGVPWDLLVAPWIMSLVRDTTETRQEMILQEPWIKEAVRLFVGAFPANNLVRIELLSMQDETTDEARVVREQLPALLDALRTFAIATEAAMVAERCHVITISETATGEVEVLDGGELVTFGRNNAALRTLLSLALLRHSVIFKVESFAEFYLGQENPGNAGKHFNNAMTELREVFPAVEFDKDRGTRELAGLYFKRVIPDAKIRAILASLNDN